jgi:hypothetical protein
MPEAEFRGVEEYVQQGYIRWRNMVALEPTARRRLQSSSSSCRPVPHPWRRRRDRPWPAGAHAEGTDLMAVKSDDWWGIFTSLT